MMNAESESQPASSFLVRLSSFDPWGSRTKTDPRRTLLHNWPRSSLRSLWRERRGEEEPMRRRDHEDALGNAAAGCVGRPARGRPNRESGALRRHRLLQLQQRPMLQGTVLLHLVSEAMP